MMVLTTVDHIVDVGVPLCHRSEVVRDKEIGNRGGVFHPSELVLLQWPHRLHTDAVIVTRPEDNIYATQLEFGQSSTCAD